MRVRFPEVETPKGAIVDLPESQRSEEPPPQDARFLSTQNRRVLRERQARMTGLPSDGGETSSQAQSSSARGRRRLDLALPEDFLRQDSVRQQRQQKRSRRRASLSPSNYLPEISLGDETLLNTREYAYATFYVRMKRQMEAIWRPRTALRRLPTQRATVITKLSITLDRRGYVQDVRLISSSRHAALDEEALRTVRQAGPYLNPPPGIIDSDGYVRVPLWHFVVSQRMIF